MPSRARVYKIRIPGGSYRLVEATSRRRALHHVADSYFAVSVASGDDFYSAWHDGVQVEVAGSKEHIDANNLAEASANSTESNSYS